MKAPIRISTGLAALLTAAFLSAPHAGADIKADLDINKAKICADADEKSDDASATKCHLARAQSAYARANVGDNKSKTFTKEAKEAANMALQAAQEAVTGKVTATALDAAKNYVAAAQDAADAAKAAAEADGIDVAKNKAADAAERKAVDAMKNKSDTMKDPASTAKRKQKPQKFGS